MKKRPDVGPLPLAIGETAKDAWYGGPTAESVCQRVRTIFSLAPVDMPRESGSDSKDGAVFSYDFAPILEQSAVRYSCVQRVGVESRGTNCLAPTGEGLQNEMQRDS